MLDTLSFVLPIYNSANSLTTKVSRLLDLLPNLVDQFEIILVDDGSIDASGDMAQNLADCYRQVKLVNHSAQRGFELAIESGKKIARYDNCYISEDGEIDERQLTQFIQELAPAPSPEQNKEDVLIERLMRWGAALREHRQKNRKPKTAHSTPAPKYASIPEKRLVELSLFDIERAEEK